MVLQRRLEARDAIGHGLLIGMLLACVPAAEAADERVLRGSAIAAAKCGKCHAVGTTDRSPHKITPPLRALVERYPVPMLVEALQTGLVAGHDEMPEFDFGVAGVQDLLAYVDSLNPAGQRYVGATK